MDTAVSIYVWSSHIARVWINRVKLPILYVVSWTGKMYFSLSTFAPASLVSRDGFGSPVPRQPAHLHTQAESGAYLQDSSRFLQRRPLLYFKRPDAIESYPSLSDHAVAYRWRSLPRVRRTGPVNLKVVPNECCLGSHQGPINVRLFFPHPSLLAWSGHVVPLHHGCTCKDTLFLSVLHHYTCIRVRACANISRTPVQQWTCTLVRWMHSQHPAAEKLNVQHAPKSLCCCFTVVVQGRGIKRNCTRNILIEKANPTLIRACVNDVRKIKIGKSKIKNKRLIS